MSVTVDAMQLGARVVSASLTLLAGLYVLYRYNQSRLRQSLYWGFGLVSNGVNYVLSIGFGAGLIGLTTLPLFVQETFLSFAITLFYYACVSALTRNRFYSTFLAWAILFLQEAVIVYFYLILNEHLTDLYLHVLFFGIPVSILVAVFFSLDYVSLRRVASILIASTFWFQAVLAVIFFVTYQTPSYWVFFVGNAFDAFVLFAGFALLAHSKQS